MNALRVIERPRNGEIKIFLPDNFNDDLVEVIILSMDMKESKSEDSRLNIAQTYLDQSQKSSFDTSIFEPHEQ
jgi:hypothetical protein